MAKRELQWVPILGQFMTLAKAIFVNRVKREDAIRVFDQVAKEMKRREVRPSPSRSLPPAGDLRADSGPPAAIALHLPRRNSLGIGDALAPPVQEGRVPPRRPGRPAHRAHRVRELRAHLLLEGQALQRRRDCRARCVRPPPYARRRHERHRLTWGRPSPAVLDPISTEGVTSSHDDITALIERTRTAMLDAIEQLGRERRAQLGGPDGEREALLPPTPRASIGGTETEGETASARLPEGTQ